MKTFKKLQPQHPHFINERIRANVVRVIHENTNKQMPIYKALELAEGADMDLVQMNSSQIPTCKIMNYSKYLFELKKKKKQEAQNNKNIIKEMVVRPFIELNDLQMKTKKIEEFLNRGSEVKLKMQLNRREKANLTQHSSLLFKIASQFESIAKIQSSAPGIISLKPLKSHSKTSIN